MYLYSPYHIDSRTCNIAIYQVHLMYRVIHVHDVHVGSWLLPVGIPIGTRTRPNNNTGTHRSAERARVFVL